MNFLKETLDILAKHDLSWDDVLWVGCKDYTIPKEFFLKEADRIYDNGFGGVEVGRNLLVVGENWWLERHEYDGAEWWEFKTLPRKPEIEYTPYSIFEYNYWRDDLTYSATEFEEKLFDF